MFRTIGLFIAMIGQDPIAALSRFTFDVFELRAGVPLLPMLIGLFAIPEILINIETTAKEFVKTKLNNPVLVKSSREVSN